MKTVTKKILFFDKTMIVLTIALLSAIIFIVISFMYTKNIENKINHLKNTKSNVQSLAEKVIHIKAIVESKENKIGLRKTGGVVATLEKILKSLGLEARVIRPMEKKKANEFAEENAELEIQGTDLNRIVNLLYKIETFPVPMKIKNAAIHTTFEDPDKFIVKLTISLLSKG